MADIDYNEVTAAYIRLRDKKKAIVKAHDFQIAQIDKVLEEAGLALMSHLLATGQESARTKAGTFFKSVRTSGTVASRETFLDWVKKNNEWDLVDVRAAKTNIAEYKEKHNDIPPGINWREEIVINIRKGTSSNGSSEENVEQEGDPANGRAKS